MSQAIIHCKYDELVNPRLLIDNPMNRNKHGSDQIERLAELYKFHGIRHPVIVSKRSGKIVAGHGRKLAAIRAGLDEMPVVYQDFESDEAEYAFIQSDNAIALWSDLDLSGINNDLAMLGPDFDINMLGIKDFVLDIAEVALPDLDEGDRNGLQQVTFTLTADQLETVKAAVDHVKREVDFTHEDNTNKNGNAIHFICAKFLNG